MPVLTKTISNYEKQLIQRLIAHEALINNAFNRLVARVSPQLTRWTTNNRNSVWLRNSRIENAIEMELDTFHQDVLDIIEAEQMAGWNLSDMKNDTIFKKYIEGMGLSSTIKEGLFTRNAEALTAFQKRKAVGLGLSDRVWNLAKQNKEHIELFLEGGIATGRSATEISRDLRQYLKNPDARFRRVLDPETGKLRLSYPAQNYHPGQGVYRSAYRNALRISRTETNMAYRFSDHERWKENETVLGVEVKLSNAHPITDICDYMAGQYPKEYKFGGWHPNCICFSIPVLLSQDDFVKHLHGDLDASKQYVKTLPKNARKYIADNTERFKGWKSQPYWLRDNFDLKKGQFVPKMGSKEVIKPVVKTIPKAPVQKPTITLENTEARIRNIKTHEELFAFDKNGQLIVSKSGEQYSVKVGDIIHQFKDKVVTHNHPRAWKYPESHLKSIGNSFSPGDIYVAIKGNVSEIRAATRRYNFVMKRPVNGWPDVYKVKSRLAQIEREVQEEYMHIIDKAPWSVAKQLINRGEAMHWHYVWKKMAKEFNFIYSKQKI